MEKRTHPTYGEVELVTPGDESSIVKLPNGILMTVTTSWLQQPTSTATAKPAAVPAGSDATVNV